MVKELRNEYRPPKPLHPWLQPPDTYKYKVRTGDTWLTLGARNNHEFGEAQLIWINFKLSPLENRYTDQVNWYLREYVGCRHSLDRGLNWAFTNDADPGYIFLPHPTYNMDGIAITGKKSVGKVTPGYSDDNAYDTISKCLDIYGVLDMGLSVAEIPIPAIVEAGMIVLSSLAGVASQFIALGAPHDAALKSKTRHYFFTAFCSSFVMSADGWLAGTVDDFYPQLAYAPNESVYPEKSETFRKMYNFGLKTGQLQGSRTNTVDKKNLFILLRSSLTDSEALYYSGDVKDWSRRKKRDYYDRLASILKKIILDKNMQVTLR